MEKGQLTGQNQSNSAQNTPPEQSGKGGEWLPVVAWAVAGLLIVVAVYLGWRFLLGDLIDRSAAQGTQQQSANSQQPDSEKKSILGRSQADQQQVAGIDLPSLPPMMALPSMPAISRRSDLRTIIPSRPEETVKSYTVTTGDSVFEIAARFSLKPESVLWANYVQLNDNPDLISLGMELNIPPVDGVLHVWKEGETIEAVAGAYQADPEAILSWPGNEIDLTSNLIQPGALVMVPGGKREYRTWIIPTIPRGRAGVSQSLYGGGACEGGYDGAYGSGAFIWPAGNHALSGNDYWDGHLGIDIAAGEGAPIYAADSGVVVFAGWATGGYGNMVMIDHGNGYQTVYAHMSSVRASCGQSVSQGGSIGYSGSTGNSTGAHLHFEVRYQGGFVSPWYVLPAP